MPNTGNWNFKPKRKPKLREDAADHAPPSAAYGDHVWRRRSHPPPSAPEFVDTPSLDPPQLLYQLCSPTGACTEARESDNLDWVQVTVDILIWKNIPRSALSFGVGCAYMLWTSLSQDMQYSSITLSAHIGLLYLAIAFFKTTFLDGATSDSSTFIPTLTEADALKLIRVFLPHINAFLRKSADLFSGEPTVTLKVATVLWLLAQAGYRVDLWTLARIAYFALFTAPKCYLAYRQQIHGQAEECLHWFWTIWESFGYKKPVMFAAFALAWNVSSLSTRMFGVFICLVTLRARQHSQRD